MFHFSFLRCNLLKNKKNLISCFLHVLCYWANIFRKRLFLILCFLCVLCYFQHLGGGGGGVFVKNKQSHFMFSWEHIRLNRGIDMIWYDMRLFIWGLWPMCDYNRLCYKYVQAEWQKLTKCARNYKVQLKSSWILNILYVNAAKSFIIGCFLLDIIWINNISDGATWRKCV